MPNHTDNAPRRYPDLPIEFERNINEAIKIGHEIGRDYFLDDRGDFVLRTEPRVAKPSPTAHTSHPPR